MHQKCLINLCIFIYFSLIIFFPTLSLAKTSQNTCKVKVLSIKKCIQIALKNNPILREQRYNIEIQNKNISISTSSFLPHVKLKGSYTRSEYPERIIPPEKNNEPGVFDKDQFLGSVELTLPIFLGGKRFYQYKASKLAKEVANYLKFMTTQELIYNIASTYL